MKLYTKFVRFLGYDKNKNEIHLKCHYLGEYKDWSKVWVLEDYQQVLWKRIVDAFKQEGETDRYCSVRLGIHFEIQYRAIFDSKMFDEPIELKEHSELPYFIENISQAIDEKVYKRRTNNEMVLN